ncbi:MAG: hypothetical protein KAU44_04875, partial [Candidatus Marinimicrobia bacterium]|nr:hypothetical protein [Candidatus Neomarinimicrobiota bacterium]
SAQIFSSSRAEARAIFMIRDFRNWLELEYEYDGYTADSAGNSQDLTEHNLAESYHFEMAYAIYNPRWLNGHLGIDLGLVQEWYDGSFEGSGNDNEFEFGYNLDGIILDRKSFPTTFFAESEETRAQRRFYRDYNLQIENYGISTTFKNRYVPVQISYFKNRSETDGLELDRVIDSETFSIDASHQTDNGFSYTEANYLHTDDKTSFSGDQESVKNKVEEFFARNSLSWGEHLERSYFISSYRHRDESGENKIKSTDWLESLSWKPGRALRLGLEYQFSGDDVESLTRKDHKYRALLEHRLYDSLVSVFRVQSRRLDFDSGTEDDDGFSLSFSYRKKLPADSLLIMGYRYGYNEIKRDLNGNKFFVINELMVVDLFERNVLDNLDVLSETITVRDQERLITYIEGDDYLVQQIGRETELIITPGSLINEGDTLSIDYAYFVDPDIDYSTTVHQANAEDSLFERRYRLYANYISSKQDLLSDKDNQELADRLYNLDSWTLGVEANWYYVNCGLEYVDYDSSTDIRQYVEAFCDYRRYFQRNFIFLYLRDRQTRHEDLNNGTDGNGGNENILTTGVHFKRRLPLSALGEINLDYLNQSGRNNDRQELDLEISYQLRVGRLEVEISLEEEWNWTDNRDERNDKVMLRIRRYF